MYPFLLSLLVSSVSAAGSICNDGTYSYSEGRGTCSWHNGVAVSGVYQDQSSSYRSTSTVRTSSSLEWWSHYSTTSDGIPYHSVASMNYNSNLNSAFSYVCFVLPGSSPGEILHITVDSMDVIDYDYTLASKDLIKVFAHTKSGYKLISGSWVFASSDGTFFLRKTFKHMESLAEPLSKADMAHVLLSDHILVSIKGYEDVTIQVPDVASKIASTWSKCNASYNAAAK